MRPRHGVCAATLLPLVGCSWLFSVDNLTGESPDASGSAHEDDASGSADATGQAPGHDGATKDNDSSTGEESGVDVKVSDVDVGAADAPEEVTQPACPPACVGLPCGGGKGDGGCSTCEPGPPAGGQNACLVSASYTVSYGDPLFDTACPNAAARDTVSCSSGAERYCEAKGFGTGFPQQTTATQMTILCVSHPAAELSNIPTSTVLPYDPSCSSSNYYSSFCESACDDYCIAKGYAGGFGPTETDGNLVSAACLPSSVGVSIVVAMSVFEGPCEVSRNQDCDAESANYCTANGYAGGFGPLQVNAGSDQATLFCIFR
jgi:hypothetical protein